MSLCDTITFESVSSQPFSSHYLSPQLSSTQPAKKLLIRVLPLSHFTFNELYAAKWVTLVPRTKHFTFWTRRQVPGKLQLQRRAAAAFAVP